MRQIVYDFAMTLDGFIGNEDGSIGGFVEDGGHLTDYLDRLKQYDTVLMGRGTYEFGYLFGLKPGELPYPHMEHYIFSNSLHFENSQVNIVNRDRFDVIQQIREAEGSAIYLCGGGEFAGSLLEHELIDQLVIKLNPVIFGNGIRAFGNSTKRVRTSLLERKSYDNGVLLLRYDVDYGA